MMEKIRALCIKHREILVYLIVGGLTTVFAWGVKFLWGFIFYGGTAYPTALQNTILNIVEWVAGVAFAYPTNRKWVFQSTNPNILQEAGGFVAARLATLGLQMVSNLLLTNVFHISFYIATVITAVLVVIGNYVFSKLLVFRKKK